MPFHFSLQNNVIVGSGTLSDLLDMAKTPEKHSVNSDFLENIRGAARDFTGNKSYKDLFENPKIKKVKTNINHKVNFKLPQRRRVRSEYDGDFSLDNKYDIKPFDATEKKMVDRKIMNLEIEMSFPGFVKAKDIENFGEMIVGVISDLENKGYLVQVFVTEHTIGATSCGKEMLSKYEIKKPNQYLSQQDIARVLNANFYRRIFLALIRLGCEKTNFTPSLGLGKAKVFSKPVEFTNEKIRFNCLTNKTSEEMLKEIYAKIS